MNISVDMRVRTSVGPIEIGEVNQDTTIGNILTKAQEIITSQFSSSREALSLKSGKQLQFIAYNKVLPKDLKIAQLISDGHISSRQDNFFYKCQVIVQ
jgi:hypothetical protein